MTNVLASISRGVLHTPSGVLQGSAGLVQSTALGWARMLEETADRAMAIVRNSNSNGSSSNSTFQYPSPGSTSATDMLQMVATTVKNSTTTGFGWNSTSNSNNTSSSHVGVVLPAANFAAGCNPCTVSALVYQTSDIFSSTRPATSSVVSVRIANNSGILSPGASQYTYRKPPDLLA